MSRAIVIVGVLCGLWATGCGMEAEAEPANQSSLQVTPALPEHALELYASQVIDFSPGEASGFGAQEMPQVVLGPPQGGGPRAGSLDVVSLGRGGQITLGFDGLVIRNGPGPDFIVFENAFFWGKENVFSELGAVEVSQDGQNWVRFECQAGALEPGARQGCAGWRPSLAYDDKAMVIRPEMTGGDPFDLEEVGLKWASYVRVIDLEAMGASPSAGVDLDAVGIVNPGRLR